MSVVLLRHASAGDRDAWKGDDSDRPLDPRGRRQAEALTTLASHGITRVCSSAYARCIQTVDPLARRLGLTVELDHRLAEGAGRKAALAALADCDGGVACTHGDIVGDVLGRSLKKGAAAVLELAGEEVRVLEILK